MQMWPNQTGQLSQLLCLNVNSSTQFKALSPVELGSVSFCINHHIIKVVRLKEKKFQKGKNKL